VSMILPMAWKLHSLLGERGFSAVPTSQSELEGDHDDLDFMTVRVSANLYGTVLVCRKKERKACMLDDIS